MMIPAVARRKPLSNQPSDPEAMTRGPLKTVSRFRSSLLYFVAGICLVYSSSGWAGSPALIEKSLVPSATRSFMVPLSFEANQGQVDEQVKYLARGQGYSLFLTPGAAVLGLRSEGGDKRTQWVSLILRGAAASAISGEQQLAGRNNYFVGSDPAQWRTNIPTFARVRYQQVYPGVDLIYYGRQGRLENDFEVNPGVNPKVISWRLEGVANVRVDSSGNLILSVGGSEVCLQQPRAYQMEGGQQQEIPVHYRVHGKRVSFALGKYNRLQKLVIDPVLTYSNYLGGSGGDTAYGVAVDPSGDAYVTGVTASTNFPSTAGAYQTTNAGENVFVTEFDPAGTGIKFSTFLGGTGDDTPAQIYLSSFGNLLIVGSTTSNNFPTTSGVFQQVYDGDQDAFLTEMSPDGTALVYSTYIGGTGTDFGTAVTVDASGNAYVVGSTNSTNFPTMNPIQLGNNGLYDAFVTEVSPTGALLYSTYVGGSLSDYGTGIAVDSTGDIYLSGYTYSTNFPTQSALQGTLAGGSDIFITEFYPGSSTLLFSTYLGGSSIDRAWGMTMDSGGNIYLAGDTESPNFPVTANAYQSKLAGTDNAFVTKLAPGASALVFSTVFGGGQTDQATALALDAADDVYITGFTQSANFPLLDPFQNVLGISGAGNCGSTNLVNVPVVLCSDAFIVKFAPTGIPVFSSFLGGSGTDTGQAITVDSSGAIYVAGGTASPNFPATAGAYQWLYEGVDASNNAFLTKISPQDAPAVALSPQEINFGQEVIRGTVVPVPVNVTLTNMGSAPLEISSITSSGDFTQTNTCGTSVAGGAGTCTISVTFAPTSLGLQTSQVSINDNAGGTQGITVTGNGIFTGGSLLFTPSTLTFSAQTAGTTSQSQSTLLINNGNQAVTITNITVTPPFTETNNCGINFPTVSASLNVGQSCTVNVSFTPTGSGNTTGSVSVTSNAVQANTGLTLSGTGSPVFSLSSNARSSIVPIGSTTASFTISALGPSTLRPNSIVLSCSSGATCSFSSSSISAGGSSSLTLTGLSATTANPLNFTVSGTSSGQIASVSLTVFFADYSLSATPTGTTITAGNNATYTITVTPTNGFNEPVLLSCPPAYPGIPIGTVCYWNPPSVVPSGTVGSTVQSTLTITSLAESRLFPHPPPPSVPPGLARWILLSALVTFLTAMITGLSRSVLWVRPRLRLAVLFFAIILVALAVGCEDYVNPININPVVNGTPAGTSSIVVTGTLGTGTGVTRTTTVSLTVLP